MGETAVAVAVDAGRCLLYNIYIISICIYIYKISLGKVFVVQLNKK